MADAPVIDGATVDASPGSRGGRVLLFQKDRTGVPHTATTAFFANDSAVITRRDEGPCRIELRTEGTVSLLSGGVVTISGGANAPVSVMPDSQNVYSLDDFTGMRYAANDVLTVSASGATVPAFNGTVAFPSALAVTNPTALTTINKAGFAAMWNATSSSVHITVTQHPDFNRTTTIECIFAGAASTGVIPAAALSDLVTGLAMGKTTVALTTRTETTMSAGGYDVVLWAEVYGLSGPVTVQP